jgi:hypothetical protein
VIVAESNKVTIYDGDDPSLPMWMVFNPTSYGWLYLNNRAIVAKNAIFSIGANGLFNWNFISDKATFIDQISGEYVFIGTAAERNTVQTGFGSGPDASKKIVNSTINDVAMTVLPDAPTDPATGLPVPTIACLVAETEVLMADGSTKRLDQVQPGEMVKTLEGEHRVLNWWDQGIKDVIELEFEGRHKITCTADHKIRTTTGWVEAGDLTEDHEVVVA